jgi:hypothetical protein
VPGGASPLGAVEQLFHQWLFQRLAPDRDSSRAQHFGSTNRQMTPLSPISLSNDLNADIGSTAHAYGLGSTELTITDRLLRGLVTRTRVPKGSVRCAAVNPWGLNFSPDAVRLPASS